MKKKKFPSEEDLIKINPQENDLILIKVPSDITQDEIDDFVFQASTYSYTLSENVAIMILPNNFSLELLNDTLLAELGLQRIPS
jgi:hypothetical protein